MSTSVPHAPRHGHYRRHTPGTTTVTTPRRHVLARESG